MKMLEELREHLEEIEAEDPRGHEFLERLLIAQEEGRLRPPSTKQFRWICDLHERWCR